jgi:hypothetical protein
MFPQSYSCNRLWRTTGSWGFEAFTFSGHSAHMVVSMSAITCCGCPLSPERFLVLISVRGSVDPRATVQLEGLGQLKNSKDLIRNRTRHLPACSIMAQLTTLPCAPCNIVYSQKKTSLYFVVSPETFVDEPALWDSIHSMWQVSCIFLCLDYFKGSVHVQGTA